MKTSDFNFELPQELIAQDPLEDRSSSRLLIVDKKTGNHSHLSQKYILHRGRDVCSPDCCSTYADE